MTFTEYFPTNPLRQTFRQYFPRPIITLYSICVQHIASQINKIADSISHFQEVCFRELTPNPNPSPDNILHGQLMPSLPPLAVPLSWHRQINSPHLPIRISSIFISLLPL